MTKPWEHAHTARKAHAWTQLVTYGIAWDIMGVNGNTWFCLGFTGDKWALFSPGGHKKSRQNDGNSW